MQKVTIKGEVFSFEPAYSVAEGIALEEGLGMTFGEWNAARQNGSVRAFAGWVWLVLRRNGHDVPLADILSGAYPLSLSGDVDIQEEGDDEGPTQAGPSSGSTGSDTSESSPSSSASGRGTSASSPSRSSTT